MDSCKWEHGYGCKHDGDCENCDIWYELLDAGMVEWSLLDDVESYDCLTAGYLGWN